MEPESRGLPDVKLRVRPGLTGLPELETIINDYDSKLGKKESKTQASHLAQNDRSELFSNAEEILKQLDNIIEGLPELL